jgi:hypothetical protein
MREDDVKSSVSEQDFAVLARRTGIPLTDAQIAVLYEAYGWVEGMTASLRAPRDRAAEPALTFDAEPRP